MSEAAMVSMEYVHCKFEMRKGAEGMLGTVGIRGHHGGRITGGWWGSRPKDTGLTQSQSPNLKTQGSVLVSDGVRKQAQSPIR